MNSLETLKQELINQKTALESKGVTLTLANTNPSPSEITSGINAIETADFSQATATETDVIAGKTFYAGNSTLKTGTSSGHSGMSPQALICGVGENEIILPTNTACTTIRDFSFMVNTSAFSSNIFYKQNLVIPNNIQHIRASAFTNSNLTGSLTVPAGCCIDGGSSFRNTNITSLIFNGNFDSVSTSYSCFESCDNLQTVEFSSNLTILPNYTFRNCTSLTHLILPEQIASIGNSFISGCTNCKYVKILNPTPPVLQKSSFTGATTVAIVVPHNAISTYWTATNYKINSGNTMIGFKTFTEGETLPNSVTGFSVTWYNSVLDANANINSVTTANQTGEYYARYVAV